MTGFDFTSRIPIAKGWSEDKKYCVTKPDGTKYLLRISPKERYENRKELFSMLKKVEQLGVPMCRPVELGVCEEGVYSLHTWIDGEEAEERIPVLGEDGQYALGLEAGRILKKIHSIPAPAAQEDWYTRFGRKSDFKIKKYKENPHHFKGDDRIIGYIEDNRDLLKDRPQCFQHGDYHIGNMMLENSSLVIIDFDRFDFGDPWEEFNRIVWCAAASPAFASGRLVGYFGGEPPLAFFKLLALYIASNALSSIYWAPQFGPGELDTMLNQARDILSWYNGMRNPIPSWYRPSP